MRLPLVSGLGPLVHSNHLRFHHHYDYDEDVDYHDLDRDEGVDYLDLDIDDF